MTDGLGDRLCAECECPLTRDETHLCSRCLKKGREQQETNPVYKPGQCKICLDTGRYIVGRLGYDCDCKEAGMRGVLRFKLLPGGLPCIMIGNKQFALHGYTRVDAEQFITALGRTAEFVDGEDGS